MTHLPWDIRKIKGTQPPQPSPPLMTEHSVRITYDTGESQIFHFLVLNYGISWESGARRLLEDGKFSYNKGKTVWVFPEPQITKLELMDGKGVK